MKIEQVRNGRLYWNKPRKQVEQVRSTLSGRSVLTARKQDGQALVATATDLRRASKKEVNSYLDS